VVCQQWNRHSRLSLLKITRTEWQRKNDAPFSLSLTTFAVSGLCSALSSSVSVLTTIQPASGLVTTITVFIWSQVDDSCDSRLAQSGSPVSSRLGIPRRPRPSSLTRTVPVWPLLTLLVRPQLTPCVRCTNSCGGSAMEPLQPPQRAQITRTVRPHDAAPMGSDIGRGVRCKLKPYFMCSAVVLRTSVLVKLSYGVHGSP